MVYEARGDNQKAADCYRKVIELIRSRPDDYDEGFDDVFVKLVEKLDPARALSVRRDGRQSPAADRFLEVHNIRRLRNPTITYRRSGNTGSELKFRGPGHLRGLPGIDRLALVLET
jgi:hypothetical protein